MPSSALAGPASSRVRQDAGGTGSAPVSGHDSFDIEAEVRFGDSLIAAVWPSRQRTLVFGVCFAILAVGAWMGDGFYDWALVLAVLLVAGVHIAVAWLLRLDYRQAGNRPKRICYHVCGSGIEVRDTGRRSEWVEWGDLLETRETPCSFLLRPSDVEQFVIPKRCCEGDRKERMREALCRYYAPARNLANAS